jgi:hypothetical protein
VFSSAKFIARVAGNMIRLIEVRRTSDLPDHRDGRLIGMTD